MRKTYLVATMLIAALVGLRAQSARFPVDRYGAKGDGATIDTDAINKAIAAAHAAGGGTVVFHAGTFVTGSIRLQRHVALFLDHGVTLESGAPDAAPCDAPEPNEWDKFQDFGHSHWHNSLISNCLFDYSRGLAIESVDGGAIEDVTIDNITMRDIANAPIFIRRGNRARTPGEPPPGVIRRITISNVVASGVSGAHGILVSGIPGYPIEDLRLSNIRIHYRGGGTKQDAALRPEEKEKEYPEPDMFGRMPSYALFARHVIGLDLRDADFSFEQADARPAVMLDDVVRVDMDHVRAQKPGGTARALLPPVHLAKILKAAF